MSEPVTLTAAAIATMILTKAFEKTGEKLTEGSLLLGGKLLTHLKRKAPKTAAEIEKVTQQPQLLEDVAVLQVLTTKIESVAAADSGTRQILEELATSVRVTPSVITNLGKLAEKIGLVVQGGTVNIENMTF